jgi:hypothetical protein
MKRNADFIFKICSKIMSITYKSQLLWESENGYLFSNDNPKKKKKKPPPPTKHCEETLNSLIPQIWTSLALCGYLHH